MKAVTPILFVLILLGSCQRDEELMSGAITGVIASYRQDFTVFPEQSGVQVLLYRNSAELDSTFTDAHGQYTFQDIPYGKYTIDYRKNGFIKTWGYKPVHHIGGYSPTLASFWLHEIPTYELQLDSVESSHGFFYMKIYLKISGDTIVPSENLYGYSFIGFADDSPGVSSSHYHARIKGYLQDYSLDHYPDKIAVYGMVYSWEWKIEELNSDTVYLRIYPVAVGQGYYPQEYYPEALGRPSNVLAFLRPE